jgi:hypothetical protein
MLGGCGRPGPGADTKGAGEAVASVAPVAPAAKRLVYPWSVVAGGVDSGAALQRAAEQDPTVAAHYGGLALEQFEARRLAADRRGYVSYRVRDRVYWTRRLVTLRAGEEVLSDGRELIRGRCGNRFSETPQLPVAAVELEPAEVAMDEPVLGAQLLTSPAFPLETADGPVSPAEAGKPRVAAGEPLTVLPAPGAADALPPAWVNGGAGLPVAPIVAGGGGGGGGGGGVAPPAPPEQTTTPPNGIIIAQGPPPTGVEIPPPLVTPPLSEPPTTVPPPGNPPTVQLPPPGNPPPINLPPYNPPGNPPPSFPPTPVPEGNPPPGGPPPTSPLPPPNGPPPGGPPPIEPPLPPPGEPPVSSVPEPGAWVLATIGLAGIALGAIGRRMRAGRD